MPPRDAFFIQLVCDCLLPIALKVHGEDPTDDGRFRFVDDQVTADKVETVCRSTAVEVAGLHSLFVTPTHIPRYRLALLLSGHTGECYDHLTIQFVSIDALFLKVDADTDVFEKADRCKKPLGVSCEARHRFDDNAVDQAFLAVSNHPVQIITLVYAGAGDSFIGIDINQPVLRMSSFIVLVVSDLCGE